MNHDVDVVLNGDSGPLSVLRAQGEDAASFLQGQLTNDVVLMREDELRLAAWCSAKGRMLASFWLWKASKDEFLLVCSRDIAAATLKRLSMFVLRAKCKITDVTASHVLRGLAGSLAQDAMVSIAGSALSIRAQATKSSQTVARLPDAPLQGVSVPRAFVLTSAGDSQNTPAINDDALAVWNWLEVMSGIARITQPVQEAFVPQMLNYESIGGVNFKKGCYPGQEVVARSQFRGAIKRRGYLVTANAPLSAGQEVFDTRDAEQPCGIVAQAASWNGQHHAIVSMQISAQDAPELKSGDAQLSLLALPYAIRDDI
jgi:tRNA-modifying protein YgfZ